jgi:hypothetical protein
MWHGYYITDYFHLIEIGELTIFRQGIGWVGFIFWIVRYWPPAMMIFAESGCLAKISSGKIILPDGQVIEASEITGIDVRHRLLGRFMIIKSSSHTPIELNVTLCDVNIRGNFLETIDSIKNREPRGNNI